MRDISLSASTYLYFISLSYVLIEFKSMKYMQNLPIRFWYFSLAVYLVRLGEDYHLSSFVCSVLVTAVLSISDCLDSVTVAGLIACTLCCIC